MAYHGESQIVMDYHGLPWIIMDDRISMDHHRLSRIIIVYNGLSWIIVDGLSILDCHGFVNRTLLREMQCTRGTPECFFFGARGDADLHAFWAQTLRRMDLR